MGGKRTRVRHAFDDGGRLSTACRRIVAKIPFLHVKEQEQKQEQQQEQQQQEEQQEEEGEEEDEEGDSLNLCQRCKELDLDGIFNGPCPSTKSEMVLTLGILNEESHCALCRFFYSMRRPSPTGGITNLYHLRKYSLSHLLSSLEFEGSTLWAVDQGSGTGSWTQGEDYELISTEMPDSRRLWFLPQSSSSEYFKPMNPRSTKPPILKGLPVNETSVNYPLLRGWINECRSHQRCSRDGPESPHAQISGPTRALNGPTIRGIDCTTRNIVNLRPDDKYIALSYVWGNKPLPENEGKQNNSRVSHRALPIIAPKVVEDAMIVVKRLGQRYLWVDQYCIDQHDEQDKHTQIRNMDYIYEGSHATIVAFSGSDSSCGLPGVSSVRRSAQPRFTSPTMTLLGFIPSITQQAVEPSIWIRRGWTFQEALLSRKLLVFTQEQVYFHCSLGAWVESCTPRPRMLFHLDSNSPWADSGLVWRRSMTSTIVPLQRFPHSIYGFQVDIPVEKLNELIQDYSGRQLSFQADALNAFRGLLSRVSIFTYWGIPCYQLPRRSIDETYRDRYPNKRATFLFLQCLCWVPFHAATDPEYLGRREAFPSWSWLGWRTPVAFQPLYYNLRRGYLFATVQIEDASGELLSIADLMSQVSKKAMGRSSLLPERTTYLWLEGLALTLGFQPGSGGSGYCGEFRLCFNHPLGYSDHLCEMQNSCEQPMYTSDGGIDRNNRVEFRFDVHGSEDIWKRTLERTWDCIFLFTQGARLHHFLILDEDKSYTACCVGTLRFKDMTEDGNLLEKIMTQVPYSFRKFRIG